MKLAIFRSLIFFILPVLFFSFPAVCPAQTLQIEDGKSISFIYPGNFIGFSKERISFLHSTMRPLFSLKVLDEFFFQRMVIAAEFRNHPELASLSTLPASFELSRDTLLKLDNPTDQRSQIREIYSYIDHRSTVIAPYKYKTARNTLVSILLPFAATDHLTITPVISYCFSMSGSEKNDLRERQIDKERGIIYGGIHAWYSF